MRSFVLGLGLAAMLPALPMAEEAADGSAEAAFLEANLLGIFYHELAHALIDIEAVPIFGQEEDAADVFSILMIHMLYEEETAQSLAYDAAFGFLGEAIWRQENSDEIAWWDTHGPDEQRYYNTVCLFYGANPEAREGFAEDFDLPQERAEYCPEEYAQAEDAWGGILDELVERGAGRTLVFEGGEDSFTAKLLAQEVAALNEELSLSARLTVREESCGEANAFYDPGSREVVFCTEFEEHLLEMEGKL